jgi:hypothetical protein
MFFLFFLFCFVLFYFKSTIYNTVLNYCKGMILWSLNLAPRLPQHLTTFLKSHSRFQISLCKSKHP